MRQQYPQSARLSNSQQAKHEEQQSQYDLLDDPFDDHNYDSEKVSSKLPPLSNIINLKFRPEQKQLHEQMIEVVRYAHKMESIVSHKNRYIMKLKYLINYLNIAQEKRDEMLSHIQEDNRKYKENNTLLQSKIKDPFTRHQLSMNTLPSVKPNNKHQEGGNTTTLQSQGTLTIAKNNHQLQSQLSSSGAAVSSLQHQQSLLLSTKKSNFNNSSGRKTFSMSSGNGENDHDNIRPSTDSHATSAHHRLHKVRPREGVDDRPQTILTVSLDVDCSKFYEEKEFVQQLAPILQKEELFIAEVKNLEDRDMITLFDSIQRLMAEHKTLFYLVFRLRKLLKASTTMSESRVFSETLESIVNETCTCLESDRASVFIYERESEQLWTKASKGSNKTIKVPFNQGIVGAVFTSGKYLNVLNAYNDERFNKEIDKMMNYKTNTVLAYPIFDKDGNNVIGVIQAVNKLKGYFSKDDEGLMLILSQLTSIVLRNSEQFDQTVVFQNNLRSIILTGVTLSSCVYVDDLIVKAEKKLMDLLSAAKAKVLLFDKTRGQLFGISSETRGRVYHDLNVGIAGATYAQEEIMNVPNAYNHPLFISEIDIDTSMPIVSMPIRKDKNSKIVGVMQVINQRGIQGLSSTNKSKVNSLDFETLEYFCQYLTQFLVNIESQASKVSVEL